MPFSSGTFTYTTSGLPVVTGTAISSTVENTKNTETATGLTTCLLKDGTQTVTANIPMAGFRFTGLGAGSTSGHSVRYEQVNGIVTTAGDLLVATGAGAFARLAVGADGTVAVARAAATGDFSYGAILRGVISGLVQSQAADTDHDTTISIGGAMDSTNAYWLDLASAITKRIDASWAVGTAAGGLDGTESVAGTPDVSTWYYIHLIARSDTGVVDALYSESATGPTMPTNYDFRRLIGAVRTDSSANIIAYTAYETEGGGLDVNWNAPTLDIDLAATLTTTRRTDAVKVPLNFSTIAHLTVEILDATAATLAIIWCPDHTDAAPSSSVAPLSNFASLTTLASLQQLFVRTSATGTIAARSDTATVDQYRVVTLGFRWARRN